METRWGRKRGETEIFRVYWVGDKRYPGESSLLFRQPVKAGPPCRRPTMVHSLQERPSPNVRISHIAKGVVAAEM